MRKGEESEMKEMRESLCVKIWMSVNGEKRLNIIEMTVRVR